MSLSKGIMEQQKPNVALLLWLSTLVGIVLIVVLALVFVPVAEPATQTDISWLMYAGLFMALPAIIVIKRQRDKTENALRMRQQDDQSLQQDLSMQMISYALAEAPIFIGVAYYVLSGDQQGLALLAAISLLLLLWTKPRRR
jgi:hypothetical protein